MLTYPLVNVYIAVERSTILQLGKINYFDWAIFNSYVKLLEGIFGGTSSSFIATNE